MKNETLHRLQQAAASFWRSMAAKKAGLGESPAPDSSVNAVIVLQHNPKEVCKLMKKAMLVLFVVFVAAAVAMAQSAGVGQSDSGHPGRPPRLRPRLRYVPRTAQRRLLETINATNDPQAGEFALWGQDLAPLYGQTMKFSGDGKATYSVTLPAKGAITSAHDANTVILFCLSCHDGNLAKVGMMQGIDG